MKNSPTPPTHSMAPMYAFYPMVVLTGFVQLLIPSTIHIIMKQFELNAGEAGILPLIYFTGMMLSAFVITHLIKKLSVKHLMVSGAAIVSAALLAASQSQGFYTITFLYFFIGFGNGIMVTIPGIYVTHVYSEKSAQLQSMIFSFLALGFVIGPIFPGIVSYFSLSWRWCLAFPGLLILPALLPIMFAKHEPIDEAKKLTFSIVKQIISFDKTFFYGIVVAIIIAAGSAVALLTWLITFLEDKRGLSLETSHIVLAAMGFGAILGRLIWARVTHKITVYRTLLFIIPFSAMLIFVAPLPSVSALNIILFFAAMIFVSGVNPLFLSAAAIYPKSHSSSAYTVLFIAMSIGGILIPFGIGQIFQLAGPVIGMCSIAILFIIVMVMLLFIKKEIPVSEHMHRNPMP